MLRIGRLGPVALASASKAKLDLLRKFGLDPIILPTKLDLVPLKGELPRSYVQRSSVAKALSALGGMQSGCVIGSDKVVALGRRILWKVFSRDENLAHIKALSGRRHRIYTGICLAYKDGSVIFKRLRIATTIVKFKRFSDQEIKEYVDSEEGIGHEGGYDFQGRAQAFMQFVRGSVSGAAGLPLLELKNLLAAKGA